MHLIAIAGCPSCAAPMSVESWSTASSTSGPVEMVKTFCARRHWFLMPRDMLGDLSCRKADATMVESLQ